MEVDTAEVDTRRKKIEELLAFTEETSKWLETTIETLEWTKESILERPSLAVCPIDSNHFVPHKVLSEHTKYCQWIKKGYSREEITKALEERSFFPYENSNVVTPVYIDEKTYQHVLDKTSGHNFGGGRAMKREMPLTIEREITELTREERLTLYNYVVNTAKEMNKKISISQDELMLFESGKQKGEGQPKTHLELLAAERDLKRRRQSYKGKSVHTSKKSHTEVIRELIANQMELLEGTPKDNTDSKEESAEKLIESQADKKDKDRYLNSEKHSKSSHDNRYKKTSEEKDEFDGQDKMVKVKREPDDNNEYDRPIKKKYSSHDDKDSPSRRRRGSRSRSRSRESHRHKHKKKKKSKKHKNKERSSKHDNNSDESDY